MATAINLKKLFIKILNWMKRPELSYSATGEVGFLSSHDDTNTSVFLGISADGVEHGVRSDVLNQWLVHADDSDIYINGYSMSLHEYNGTEWFTHDTSTVSEVTTCKLVRWGNVAMIYIILKNKSAITVATTGNVTDVVLGTISAGFRPRFSMTGVSSGNSPFEGSCWYSILAGSNATAPGRIALTAVESIGASRTIAAGTSLYIRSTYICETYEPDDSGE